ncbi:hypothetical protein JZ751_002065 [Albula glossodonta]|uniref:Uncharacterized protein n=1 Tax=Albula glossodonta TaxID=121402 RepID=A0A8T2P8U4_9TELE|nr:hypothetical protein JZ751_002065 [Albula glossodonta]
MERRAGTGSALLWLSFRGIASRGGRLCDGNAACRGKPDPLGKETVGSLKWMERKRWGRLEGGGNVFLKASILNPGS